MWVITFQPDSCLLNTVGLEMISVLCGRTRNRQQNI